MKYMYVVCYVIQCERVKKRCAAMLMRAPGPMEVERRQSSLSVPHTVCVVVVHLPGTRRDARAGVRGRTYSLYTN